MPMYEYACKTCGKTIEVIERLGAPPRTTCGEDCALDYGDSMGQGEVLKVLSVTGGYQMGAPRSSGGSEAPYCGKCGQNRTPCDN